MVFSSLSFLFVFLPVVFLLHCVVPGVKAKNALLIVFSLVFYAYGEPVYVLLMIVSSLVNYLFGRLMGDVRANDHATALTSHRDTPHPRCQPPVDDHATTLTFRRRSFLVLGLVFNLGMLCVFKYADLVVGTIDAISGVGLALPGIALPIGISFFTFQAMSYLIDAYRGETEVCTSFWRLLLYISFFPQLIAGPIVKYHDIADQIEKRTVTVSLAARGLRRFCFGLAKKVLLANQFALVADTMFEAAPAELGMAGAWLGAFAYMMQIYFDFSGYSCMAIGLGQMFGFQFKENFNYPYISRNITEFWRRWHISLSTWFKEYVYIPLGGNRRGVPRACLNKVIVFALCGIWHGASWTFLLWGLYQGLFLLLEMFIPRLKKLPIVVGNIYTWIVVLFGWVLFRAESLDVFVGMVCAMFGVFGLGAGATADATLAAQQCALLAQCLTPLFVLIIPVGIVASTPIAPWLKRRFTGSQVAAMSAYLVALVLLVLCLLELSSGSYNPFIYFRF